MIFEIIVFFFFICDFICMSCIFFYYIFDVVVSFWNNGFNCFIKFVVKVFGLGFGSEVDDFVYC